MYKNKKIQINKCRVWYLGPLLLTMGVCLWLNDFVIAYQSKGLLIYAISGIMAIVIIDSAIFIEVMKNVLKEIGEVSFSIYLLHMPLAGAVCNIFTRWWITRLCALIYPLICVIIMWYLIYKIKKMWPQSWLCKVLGIL